jgi:NAD(P)-dependent dehydrogenase (short-subunit alcohol dehydrogenase family)
MNSAAGHDGRLHGRRILIVGAGSGIGRATSELFHAEGAALALIDRDATALSDIRDRLQAQTAAADITDEKALVSAIKAVGDALGGLDGLVVSAGIGSQIPFAELDRTQWQRVVDVNLTGSYQCCRLALPYLQASKNATIVTVASAAGLLPAGPGLAAYAASKAGLIAFTKAIAHELAPNIRANTVCPGPVDTPLLPEAFRAAASLPRGAYAMGRVAQAEEIARGILFLTASDSSFVTGVALAIDGGRTFH